MNCPPLQSAPPPDPHHRVTANQIVDKPGLAEIIQHPAACVRRVCRDQVPSNNGIGLDARDAAAIAEQTRASVRRRIRDDDVADEEHRYASKFPIVEVDSTYYFPPSESNSVLWIERTPPEFTFNIKAYSLLTNHPTKRESLYKDLQDQAPADKKNVYREQLPDEAVDEVWQRFRDALMPLHSAGKLGAVLFQFPQWFVISKKSKAYIDEVVERLPDYRVAVEFRHKSWMEERNVEETLSFLEERDLPFVCVDMPQGFDSSIPPIAAATAKDLAMVRFHGRDRDVWERKGTPRRSGSATTTSATSSRSGCPRSRRWPPKRERPTC